MQKNVPFFSFNLLTIIIRQKNTGTVISIRLRNDSFLSALKLLTFKLSLSMHNLCLILHLFKGGLVKIINKALNVINTSQNSVWVSENFFQKIATGRQENEVNFWSQIL